MPILTQKYFYKSILLFLCGAKCSKARGLLKPLWQTRGGQSFCLYQFTDLFGRNSHNGGKLQGSQSDIYQSSGGESYPSPQHCIPERVNEQAFATGESYQSKGKMIANHRGKYK